MRIEQPIEEKVTVERSRFHALLAPVRQEEELDALMAAARREYPRACHHCWAWRVRDAAGVVQERWRDDGEVGHPGRVLLEVLRRRDLEGAVLVSRIFGGVKLGVGGVARAFREAGEAVTEAYCREHPAAPTPPPAPPPTSRNPPGKRRR